MDRKWLSRNLGTSVIQKRHYSLRDFYLKYFFTNATLVDFVVSPLGCDLIVTDAHEAKLRCPDEVDGDIWI
jgi:hypothetical protein